MLTKITPVITTVQSDSSNSVTITSTFSSGQEPFVVSSSRPQEDTTFNGKTFTGGQTIVNFSSTQTKFFVNTSTGEITIETPEANKYSIDQLTGELLFTE